MMLDIFDVLEGAMTEAFRAGYEAGFSDGFHCEDNPGMIDEANYDKEFDAYMEDAKHETR